MSNIKKIMISRYDARIKTPPYKTIQIDKMLIEQPENDNLGEVFCEKLRNACYGQGYKFKFYTMSPNPEFDYEVVVQ